MEACVIFGGLKMPTKDKLRQSITLEPIESKDLEAKDELKEVLNTIKNDKFT